MKRDISAYQADLLQACRLILEFVGEKKVDDYTDNMLVKSAVERQFEVIGEVLNRMSREFPLAYAQIRNARQIIDLRNIIAHGYDVIDDATIYNIVKVNVPELLSDAKELK